MLTPKQLDEICENARRARTLEDFVREAAQAADRMLNMDGEVTPFWLVDTSEKIAMAVTPFVGDSAEEVREAKEAIVQKMREFMREHGAERYVFVAESWTYDPVRRSSQLPDDEGIVFTTNVASSPIQASGRRGNDGRLYVGNAGRPPRPWSEVVKSATDMGVEVVTGAEAEQLLADIQADMSWDGVSMATHPRRKEVVLFSAEDRSQALYGLRDIVRSDRGKAHLSELRIYKDENSVGLFTGLLQEHAVH
jgi:hypothetical protein